MKKLYVLLCCLLFSEIIYASNKKNTILTKNSNIQEEEIIVIDEAEYLAKDKLKQAKKNNITEEEVIVIDEEEYLKQSYKKNNLNKKIVNETKSFSDDDAIILSVKLKKYFLTDSLIAYLNNTDLYIPLNEFLNLISFNIKVDEENKTADGFFLNSTHKFEMNLKNNLVISDEKKFTINKNEIIPINNILYVKPSALEKWFPLDIKFNLNDLMLFVNSPETMPAEINKAIENRRKILSFKKNTPSIDNKKIIEVSDLFSKPSFDLTLSKTFNKLGKNKNYYNNYFINMANIFYGYDTSWYFYGTNLSDAKLRVNAKRYQPFNNHNFFKDVEFGDVMSSYIPLISNSSMGKGIYFSSTTNGRVSQSKTVDITGYLPNGYEVELYKDGNIIDFITNTENGMYVFKDVPVSIGLNVFKLVFINAYGEQREEERTFYISPTNLKKGEFQLTGSITDDNSVVFALNDDNRSNDSGLKFNLEGLLGLNSSMALSFAISHQSEILDKSQKATFLQTGLLFGTSIGAFESYIARNNDNGKNAYSISMTNQINNWTLFSKFDNFNGIHSASSYFYGEYTDDMLELKLNGRFVLSPVGNIFSYMRYRKYSLYKDLLSKKTFADETIIRFSYPLRKLNLGLEYNAVSLFNEDKISDVSLKGIYKWGIASIKSEYIYNINPNKSSSTFSLRSDFKSNNTLSYYTEWQHSYLAEYDNFLFGITKKTGIGNISIALSTSTNSNKSVLLSYNVGLLAKEKSMGFDIDDYDSVTTTGAVNLRAFLDKNSDSVFNDNDELLQNVKVEVASPTNKEFTDKKGELLITGLLPYELTKFRINTDKLEDISYIPLNNEFWFIPRSGYCKDIDIPIIQAGELEGLVLVKKNKTTSPIKGIIVKIVNEQNNKEYTAITSSDGSFVVSKLQYGKYKLSFDKTQLKSLNFKEIKDSYFDVNEAYVYINPITFESNNK